MLWCDVVGPVHAGDPNILRSLFTASRKEVGEAADDSSTDGKCPLKGEIQNGGSDRRHLHAYTGRRPLLRIGGRGLTPHRSCNHRKAGDDYDEYNYRKSHVKRLLPLQGYDSDDGGPIVQRYLVRYNKSSDECKPLASEIH